MTKIVIFGDPDCTGDTVKVLDAIFKFDANADLFVNEGDNGYSGKYKKSIALLEKYFPKGSPQHEKLRIALGNHDHEESEPEETEAAYGAFLPKQFKYPPEFDKTDQSWENTKWLYGEQVGDIYNFIMNSQDLDIVFKRNQYNWVVGQLGIAASLRKSGKIKWIIGHTHKPWFTLKSSHSPYTDVREIYTKIFENIVNQMWHGHNHNDQAWRSMIAIKVSGNASGKVIESLLADGKTIDHSKPHGWTTNINGHSGHEHNAFKEDAKANKNVMWSNAKVFTYSVVESKGNILNTKWKDVTGKVLFEYNISYGTVSQPPSPQTPPPEAPPTKPPGEGFTWNKVTKKWDPILEHPSFLPDHQEPSVPTPPAKPLPPQPNTPTPDNTGVLDQMGIKWIVAKGKQSMIEQTRDEATDDRWSGNVTGLRNGFEATMIAKGTGTSGDAHFAMKQFSGNHSGSGTEKNAWYDTGLRQDGSVQLQTEYPHPKNHDFTLPDANWFIKKISKGLEGNMIGLKWCVMCVKPNGTRKDGIRLRMWVDEDPIDPATKKPRNNWKLVYDAIDTGQIIPADKQLVDEQDCEVRRSDTKSHEVFGGGLHVRAL
jgi:hypothetical protein